jgi:hypothetical protein
MLKFKVSRRLYPLMMVWAVLQSFGLLVDQRAVGSGGPFFYACYCFRLFFLAVVLFYVGDASASVCLKLNSIGLPVPHRKHITSPLQGQQVNAIYRFVKMVY